MIRCFARSLFLGVASVLLLAGELQSGEPFIASELIFPLHPQHNHAPGIAELANGDMIVSWYRGSGERRADDVAVWGARRPKGSDEWTEPFLMADTPGFPDCNTAMMVDAKGRLFLFWPMIIANSWESCVTQLAVADEPIGSGSPRWTRHQSLWLKPKDFSTEASTLLKQLVEQMEHPIPASVQSEIDDVQQRLSDPLFQRLGWQPRCKPTILPSGRILLPLYSDTFSFSLMGISDDGGETWRASKPLLGFGNIQPSVLRRNDGTLVAYMRENGPLKKVRVAESVDEGESWTLAATIDIPNPGSGLDGLRLSSGNWILISNDIVSGRNRLSISLSQDEGRTWSRSRTLEDASSGSFHYPAVIQSSDKRIHIVYSYFVEGGKSMKHVEFEESWLVSTK